MNDKIRIIYSPLADFSTAPWGVLKVIDEKVVLDVPKAFNRARRALNMGANAIRVLRHSVWENQVPFDWEHPDFWPLFREWIQILHNPRQGPKQHPDEGADVLIDIIDGCGAAKQTKETLDKEWIYSQPEKVRRLIRAMFSNVGDFLWVKFRVGNEINQQQIIALNRNVVYDEFKKAGRVPYNYGPAYSSTEDFLETTKKHADDIFHLETTKIAFRDVHGVRNIQSPNFKESFAFWAEKAHPIRAIWSNDGVHPRPTTSDWFGVVNYILNNAAALEIPQPLDTKVKYGIECLGEETDDYFVPQTLRATSEAYIIKFVGAPINFRKYPNDWQEPQPPVPPTPPSPPPPPSPPEEQGCHQKFIADRPISKWQIGKFIRCIFGI